MGITKNTIDKLFLKQWSIGITDSNIETMLREKKTDLDFKWIPIGNKRQFFADPFIFKINNDQYSILYEDFDYTKQYGRISMCIVNNENQVISKKVLLDTNSHLSYPGVYAENSHLYIFPEAGQSGKLTGYQFDFNTMSLINKKDIIKLSLVDATFQKHDNKYWIFSAMKGEAVNSDLYIYYSENLWGPYTAHPKNPVKSDAKGTRPAGNLLELDGNLYRPAQNSEKYYGTSIIINKIIALNENDFQEEFYLEILPGNSAPFNCGIHTINYTNNKIVVDGLSKRFLPLTQLKKIINNRLSKNRKSRLNAK